MKKVLIVEDHRNTGQILKSVLRRLGFEPQIEYNGMDACSNIIGHPKDTYVAIISDMNMRGGSGLDLCQMLYRRRGDQVPPMLIHSSEMQHRQDGECIEDINSLRETFPFVREVHQKPPHGDDYSYVKTFLERLKNPT